MNTPHIAKTLMLCLVTAGVLTGCNLGSYDDAAADFRKNAPPPPPPPAPPPPPPPGGFGPNFSEIQASVFTPDCATAGCHSGANPDANLNLEAANSYTNLVAIAATQDGNVQRVNPGNPDMSYLVTKLEGPGASGGQMPPGGPLPQSEIDVIRQWIFDGAVDDRSSATSAIRVTTLIPSPGAALQSPPARIVAGFDRDLDATSVDANTFLLVRSGGDGIFGNGNDASIVARRIVVPAANPRSAHFDLHGITLVDDIYRVILVADGGTPIMDLGANTLAGDFIATFSVESFTTVDVAR